MYQMINLFIMVAISSLGTIDAIMTIGALSAAIATGVYVYKSRAIKDLADNVIHINNKLDIITTNQDEFKNNLFEIKKELQLVESTNYNQHQSIFDHINKTTGIVQELIIITDISKTLDGIVSNAIHYASNKSLVTYMELWGMHTKEFVSDVIKNDITKISVNDLTAKIDVLIHNTTQYLPDFNVLFVSIINPPIVELSKKYLIDLTLLQTDIINDKNLRLKIRTSLFLQDIFSLLVKNEQLLNK